MLLLLFGELFIEPITGAQVALPAVGCVPPGLAWSTLERGGDHAGLDRRGMFVSFGLDGAKDRLVEPEVVEFHGGKRRGR